MSTPLSGDSFENEMVFSNDLMGIILLLEYNARKNMWMTKGLGASSKGQEARRCLTYV
jgi:hypothetical protein